MYLSRPLPLHQTLIQMQIHLCYMYATSPFGQLLRKRRSWKCKKCKIMWKERERESNKKSPVFSVFSQLMLRHQQHLAVYRRTKEFYSWFQCSVFRHNSTERLQSSTEFYWNQSTQSEIYFDGYSLNVSLVIQKKRTVILLFRQKSQCLLSRVSTALFLTFLLGFYLDL